MAAARRGGNSPSNARAAADGLGMALAGWTGSGRVDPMATSTAVVATTTPVTVDTTTSQPRRPRAVVKGASEAATGGTVSSVSSFIANMVGHTPQVGCPYGDSAHDRPPVLSQHVTNGRIRGLVRELTLRQMLTCGVVVAVVLAVFALVLVRITTRAPAEVVHDYLSALREGDPDRALHAAGISSRPSGPDATFLTAQALMPGWTFTITEVITFSGGANVSVDLLDTTEPAPAQTVSGWQPAIFQLEKRSGRWRIEDPYGQLTVQPSPMRYLQIGGVRRAIDPAGTRTAQKYLVFPGIYTPYSGHSGLAAAAPARVVVPPLFHGTGEAFYEPHVRPTADGNAALQKAADDFLDRCLTQAANHPPGCTLANQDIGYRSAGGYVNNSALAAATYTLVRHPTVTLTGQLATMDDGSLAFTTQVTVPGEVHLTATGRNLDGQRISFAMACLVNRAWLVAAVGADGTLMTQWQPNPLDQEINARGQYVTLDCHA